MRMKLIHLARQKQRHDKRCDHKLHCPSYYGLLNLSNVLEKQFRRCRNVGRENMFPNKKYRTIYADPPWHEKGGGKIKRGADRHYPLMRTEDVKEENQRMGCVGE